MKLQNYYMLGIMGVLLAIIIVQSRDISGLKSRLIECKDYRRGMSADGAEPGLGGVGLNKEICDTYLRPGNDIIITREGDLCPFIATRKHFCQ